MTHARRSNRRRLGAAITAVLAVTIGTPAAPAFATPVTAAAAQEQEQAVVPFPAGAEIAGAGTTGFLSKKADGYRWTRYADGRSTLVSQGRAFGTVSDVVVTRAGEVVKLQDMATNAAPVEIDMTALGGTYSEFGAVGSTLLATTPRGPGVQGVHLIGSVDGTVSNRAVTGLPSDAHGFALSSAVPGSALLTYTAGPVEGVKKTYVAVVDIAAGAVTHTYEKTRPILGETAAALSATHVAWLESSTAWAEPPEVVVVDRSTGTTKRYIVGDAEGIQLGLVGGWVTYGEDSSTPDNRRIPFTAQSLGSAAKKEILAHVTSITTAPDGSLLVRGGSVADGEGLYRVSDGGGETPATELVASTGEDTGLRLLGHHVPEVIDLDKNRGIVQLELELNRRNDIGLSIEIARPGRLDEYDEYVSYEKIKGGPTGPGTVAITWSGSRHDGYGGSNSNGAAYNGDYEWRLRAGSADGVGPVVEATGTFKVVRKPATHDFTDNGSPDLAAVDSAGQLVIYDSDYNHNMVTWPQYGGAYKGWNIYDRVVTPGNLGGSPDADLVARDRSGGLWLYPKDGEKAFDLLPRQKIGTGWGIYDKIVGGSDLTGDGKPDLLATDKAGVLWLYPGTGNVSAPLGDRKKIGGGWGIYNQITAVGNIAGAPAGDLVARDSAGVLWLYLGKGDGTFATRARIGGGWNAYKQVVGVGDANRDGRPDLFAYIPGKSDNNPDTGDPKGKLYVYESTGDWRAPFRPRSESWDPVFEGNSTIF
ncbi:FG-GAP repeat domain-containing protein [Streptomyces sp. NPDC048370]|uniref:FG-GAP repeat domain-containing protein n=1 Tax=Streptomyces sp. NPDC048370 TaxID=3365540 RepID=UPI003720E12C